jgi:carboxypeptidase family protein
MKCALFAALLLGFIFTAGPARAQGGSQSSQLRGVSGIVFDKSENPIASAVVYLKNVRSLTVRTYITDQKGEYHFSGLDPNTDYEIHAESDDMTSANHTVSSLDSRKEMSVTLKIDKEKKKSAK